jgi:hypothetical protein
VRGGRPVALQIVGGWSALGYQEEGGQMAFVTFPRMLGEEEALDLACHLASHGGRSFPRRPTPPTPRYIETGAETVAWAEGERRISITKERGYGADHGEYPASFEIVLTGGHPGATLRMAAVEDWWSPKADKFECDGISIWNAESKAAEETWAALVHAWFSPA